MLATRERQAASGGEGGRVLTRVVGRTLPPLCLPSTLGEPVDLSDLDRAVIYTYPGKRCSPEDGHESPQLDETQHRVFADHWPEFLALNCHVLGVSSQPLDEQDIVVATLGIGHPLVCDREAQLAHELGLPTFSVDDREWYCRVTVVVNDGAIAQAFFPIATAARSSAQAVAWMQRQRWS